MSQDLQTLLELLNRSREKKEKKNSMGEEQQKPSPLEPFIERLKLEDGKDKIPSYIVFYLYKTNGGKLPHNQFFKEFAKLFRKGRNGNQRYYFLNKSNLNNYRDLRERAKIHESERKNKKR